MAGTPPAVPTVSAQRPGGPVLCGTPRLDQYVTSLRPLLSWPNSEGGVGPRTYVLQLDTSPSFDTPGLIECRGIPEGIYTTAWHLGPVQELRDKTRYFWRVQAVDATGASSDWGGEVGGITARFLVDTSWNDGFVGVRVPVREIAACGGYGIEHIQDYEESGATYWEGFPNQDCYWVKFDLGGPVPVSRIWLLCGMAGWKPRECRLWSFLEQQGSLTGRLTEYEWQCSQDNRTWETIRETRRRGADGFKGEFVLDGSPVTARYFRLLITGWVGPAPRVHEVTFYTPGSPPVPRVPDTDYVLVIGNYQADQRNVNTTFRDVVLGRNGHAPLPWALGVVEVPHYAISLEILERLARKPVAIFLTGFGRWSEMLPQFEYNGVYEIIREAKIPIFASCGGHQLLVQQEDFTFARDTGRSYYTASVQDLAGDIPPVHMQKQDPIFAGMVDPFYAPQYHSWTVDVLPADFEVLATSRDARGFICNEVIRAKDRLVYGVQFHPEMGHPWNAAKPMLVNFLRMALGG